MTFKTVVYSKHASQRMQLRGVRRSDVRRVLELGTAADTNGVDGMRAKATSVRGESLVVQYKESATGIYVVTVYFANR